jgi:diadenosine tetraphosphatase ApaH/serine/threonine PP2A family protein phosphatase
MRVAVISDIHANAHALDAVLLAVDAEAPDAIWCLGDLVGYGPRPNDCCDAVAARASVSLAGNHDLGVLGTLDLADFSDDALASALWTRDVLTPAARAYLERLPSHAREEGVELYHASARDPVWEYVLSGEAALASLDRTHAPVVLVGHSHVPLSIVLDDGILSGGVAPGGHEEDLTRGRWLLNPGSVGQPRDGDPRAAYLLLDLEQRTASFRRVDYDVERTQAEIRELGLPDALAARLGHGV